MNTTNHTSPIGEDAATVAATVHVECRECRECDHVGINDGHPTDAACGYPCGWSGPSPKEDKCPDCGHENVMSIACPKCSGLYRLIAECDIAATVPSAVENPIGEDAANVAIGEREACDAAYAKQAANRRTNENDFGAGWEYAIEWMQARAALTAEKVAAEPVRLSESEVSALYYSSAHDPLSGFTAKLNAALDRISAPQPAQPSAVVLDDERAAWFALADGAAAEIEQAAISITDPDAKRVVTNAAAYVRRRCKALVAQREETERDDSSEAK